MDTKVKNAEKAIRRIRMRYPEKSGIQLLRRIRMDVSPFAEWIEIARIERNQAGRLTPDDRMFIAGEKQILLQAQPDLATTTASN